LSLGFWGKAENTVTDLENNFNWFGFMGLGEIFGYWFDRFCRGWCIDAAAGPK
jgi:hypothetical protein